MTPNANTLPPAERWLVRFLYLHAAFIPISIAAGQVWALLASLLFLVLALARPQPPGGYPLARLTVLYVAAILFSIAVGARPLYALSKADRLLLFAIPVALGGLALRRSNEPVRHDLLHLVAVFLAGCSAKALYDGIRIPAQYFWLRHAAANGSDGAGPALPGLFDLGNMRDPQFYAAAVCLLVALWICRAPGFSPRLVLIGLMINSFALVLHFKRGAWFSTVAGVLLVVWLAGRRVAIGWIVLGLALATQIPAVQERILLIKEEFRLASGGRYALWTAVGPQLFREYPLGMGWRSVRHADLQHSPGAVVQPKLNHLHNNVLQIRLETGWIGLAAWLMLNGAVLTYAVRGYCLATRANPIWRGPALGLLAALVALHLNGLVEYNAGDAEIFMMMNLLAGLAVAGYLAFAPGPPAEQPTPAATRGC